MCFGHKMSIFTIDFRLHCTIFSHVVTKIVSVDGTSHFYISASDWQGVVTRSVGILSPFWGTACLTSDIYIEYHPVMSL